MEFYYLRSFDEDLESGAFGVLEPKIGRCEKMTDFSNSICIVPGLAFDNEGYRLGYGKGYYDRFLCNYPGVKIGICYASCVKRELPHGFYDVPVGILVTDRYLHRVKLQNSRFRRR